MKTEKARCNHCGRTFKNSQGVKAHLKSCPDYRRKKNRAALSEKPSREPGRSGGTSSYDEPEMEEVIIGSRSYHAPVPGEPLVVLMPKGTHRDDDTPVKKPKWQNKVKEQLKEWEREDAAKRKKWEEQEERRRREEKQEREEAERHRRQREAEDKVTRRREIIQSVKQVVIDCYFVKGHIPNEAKADAKVAIEKTLENLSVLELPRTELNQIAEGIRDKIYAPYKDPIKEEQTTRKEVLDMPKKKLFSGIYECPDCGIEFTLDRADEDDLLCDCGAPLELVEDDVEE